MSDIAIVIVGATCQRVDCVAIYNDKGEENGDTGVSKRGTIHFVNTLHKAGNAEIKFFKTTDLRKLSPISDFCVESEKELLKVPVWKDCTIKANLAVGEKINYTVSVPEHLILDPIIIIDGNYFQFTILDYIFGAVIALLTVALGHAYLTREKKQKPE